MMEGDKQSNWHSACQRLSDEARVHFSLQGSIGSGVFLKGQPGEEELNKVRIAPR